MKIILTLFACLTVSVLNASAADAKAGEATYARACKSCHGANGSPNPAIAKMMKVEMKDLKSAEVQALSDAELRTIITDGRGKMKPVKTVSAAEADNVIAYIRTWKK
jgi:mono/diheme cytochrome c family protein